MATEKRHIAPASSSKQASSLFIQLPSTSANNHAQLRDRNHSLAPQRNHDLESQNSDSEQNNMLDHTCARNREAAAVVPDQVTRGGGSLLTGGDARRPQTHHRHLHHQHQNHMNNFHNHILSAQQQQQRASSEQRLMQQHIETDSEQDSVTPPPHYHDIPGVVPPYQGRSSGPPPAYDDVINPNAPPPSYQSLFGQVREARKTSNGLVDLFRQLFLVLIGTIGCTMIIGFLLLIPITMILVGIVYVNDCRAENIPMFLVIGGVVWIIKNVLNCYNQFKKDASTNNRPPPRRHPIAARQSTSSSVSSTSFESTSASVLIANSPPAANAVGDSSSDHSDVSGHMLPSSTGSNASSDGINSEGSQQSTPTIVPAATTISSNTTTTRGSTYSSTTAATTTTTTTNSRSQMRTNHIRHPPMIGLTSYKCESMLNYFMIVWFLAGCIVVYRIYEPDYDNPASANYCNRLVYMYAFWLMTSAFIVTAIILSCLCCLMVSSLISCSHGR